MSKLVKYILISDCVSKFSDNINHYLQLGYVLLGELSIQTVQVRNHQYLYFNQAMGLYEDK